jgi:hypothetical protein
MIARSIWGFRRGGIVDHMDMAVVFLGEVK